ncbi:hypothetical protein A7M79_01520 [Acinetobacter baumannii]|uniref:hypothetical protein n=1 Tax=Acinetobacter baumannii TaxID=470 RepID=UPI0008DC9158|nr:hypothetical protein [Acinetobacter baumannii]OIH12195.1 hypothetical protein A7M79_01520 [Acinetobacter baumannii]
MTTQQYEDFLEFLKCEKENLNKIGILQFDKNRHSFYDENHCNISGAVSIGFTVNDKPCFVSIDSTISATIESGQLFISGIMISDNAEYNFDMAFADLDNNSVSDVKAILDAYWSPEKMTNWKERLESELNTKEILDDFS